jgi:hypothetical protein
MFKILMLKLITNMICKSNKSFKFEDKKIKLIIGTNCVIYLINLANKMLLWHGSRLTNYVGILSKGLKIAPL